MAWKSSLINTLRIGGTIPKKFRSAATVVGIAVSTTGFILAVHHALITSSPEMSALFIGMILVMGLGLVRSGESENE